MSSKTRFWIGGLGALTPILMNLLIIDFSVLFLNLTSFAALGYAIRVIILFGLGGLVAWLHEDETRRFKIFELGILAPAIITALINANNVDVPKAINPHNETPSAATFFIPSAYAQTIQEKEIKTFSAPKENLFQQLWRGLSGSSYDRVWFIIVGQHGNLEDAKNQARQINQEKKGFEAEVYQPYDEELPYYSVVIGANLTYSSAQRLRYKAIKAGLPKDMFLWTFPK